MYKFVLGIALLTFATSTACADIVGTARVIDGDTIVLNDIKVRLEGIDAPEQHQSCAANGVQWACGATATAWVSAFVADRTVACVEKGQDRYGRTLATCFVGGENLNDKIVREGWALDYRRYSMAYVDAENEAKRNGVGIWRGDFEAPWDWRRHR